MMEKEEIGNLYDPRDPRRNVWDTISDFKQTGGPCLRLGIHYRWGLDDSWGDGHLFILKNVIPKSLDQLPVRPLLTENEILGDEDAAAEACAEFGGMQQTELGGCCCDCCHRTQCNRCFTPFPKPPTMNQFLTPQICNSLCRLGHSISGEAIRQWQLAGQGQSVTP